jgi:hypothetical protein
MHHNFYCFQATPIFSHSFNEVESLNNCKKLYKPNDFQVLQRSNGGFQKYSNLNKRMSIFYLYFPL